MRGKTLVTKESSNKLRQTMIEAGVVVLERDQLRLVAESISYAKVFAYLEQQYSVRVTRASVHERIWESHDHFRQDVLTEAINYFPTVLPDERIINVFEAALKIAHNEPTLDKRIDTFVRLVFAATGEIVQQSPARRHLQSAKAISSRFNDPKATTTFPTLLNDHLKAVTDAAVKVFGGIQLQLGIQNIEGVDLDATAAAYLAETLRSAIDGGAFLNSHAGSIKALQPVRFKGIEPDTPQAWFPASIGQSFLVHYLHTPADDTASQRPQLETDWVPDPNTSGLPEQHVSEPNVRRPREELKKLVLAGGVDLLLNTASELRPASLTYANVFKHIKETTGTVIHRASVHKRIWAAQEDFVLDVLNHSLLQPADDPLDQVNPATEIDTTSDSADPYQVAQDRIRQLSLTKSTLFSDSTSYRRLLLTKAALFGKQDPETVNSVRATIQQIDDEFVDGCKQLAKTNLLDLGFEARPELEISDKEALELFGVLLLTVVTGLNFDHMAGIESSFQTYKIPRVDGNSGMDEWPLEGVAAWIFFDQIFTQKA